MWLDSKANLKSKLAINYSLVHLNNLLSLISIAPKENKRTLRNHEMRQNSKSLTNTKFIQTQGVFSEGSGEIRPNVGRSESHNHYRQQDVIPIPKIRKQSFNVSE